MEKASKALRRSSAKLKAYNRGDSPELHVATSEIGDVRAALKTLSAAQSSAFQHLLQWSAKEGSLAIQDVVTQMEELSLLMAESILCFSDGSHDLGKACNGLLEDQRSLCSLREKLNVTDRKVTKLRAELRKASKKASIDKAQRLQEDLSEAERIRGLLQLEVADRLRENEVIKSIRFKQGVLRLAAAGVKFGQQIAILHEALRDLADQIPDAHEQELESLQYSGFVATRECVARAREEVRQCSRGRDAAGRHRVSAAEMRPLVPRDITPEQRRTVYPDVPPPYSPGSFSERWSWSRSSAPQNGSASQTSLAMTPLSRETGAAPTASTPRMVKTVGMQTVTTPQTPTAVIGDNTTETTTAPRAACAIAAQTHMSSGYISAFGSPLTTSSAASTSSVVTPAAGNRGTLSLDVPTQATIGNSLQDGNSSQPTVALTALSPCTERLVERQVLYRMVTSTPILRQSSITSNNSRRRLQTSIGSQD